MAYFKDLDKGIRSAIKEEKVHFDTGKKDIQIGFIDYGDEAEFTVSSCAELIEVWTGFCKENGLDPNNIDYVTSRY